MDRVFGRRLRRPLRMVLLGVAALGASVVVWVWWQPPALPKLGWGGTEQASWIVSMVLGVAGTVATMVGTAATVRSAQSPASLGDVGVVADLAARLERDWAEEAVRREVTRPAPLRVSWSSTGRPAASREAVTGERSNGGWRRFPLCGQIDVPLPGQRGEINRQIVSAFRGLPRRQLVVLGEPGAGKSVFAILLTLGLIRTRVEGEPLPVLLAINAWDSAEPVDVFVARHLAEDYADVLAGFGDPRAVAERLVEHRQVVPVLDGLDELPASAIGQALQALDAHAAAGRPLVVTCRISEYERAVNRSETILTTAAVVELEPVTIDAVVEYLSYPEQARPRWEPVFAHLRPHLDGDEPQTKTPANPLAQALSTPLMVALARTAYKDPGTDPAELLKLTTLQAVTSRLMDAFVTAAYTHPPERRSAPTGLRWRRHDPARARRWLTCLAYHLYQSHTRDWHWWQLNPVLLAARPDQVSVMTTALAMVIGGLSAGLVGASVGASGLGSSVTGILIMLTAANGLLRPMWPYGYPPYIQVRFRTRRQRRIERVTLALGYGIVGGQLIGLITEGAAELPAGLVYGLLTAVVPSWRPASPIRQTSTSPTDLVHNRRNIAAAASQQALTSGALFVLVGALAQAPTPLATGITAAVVYGITAGLMAGAWTWIRFRLTHTRLALQGWLPWRLQSFLAGAHHHGVLRQTGTVYQFRHAILQDHLKDTARTYHLQLQADAGDRHAAVRLADLLVEQGHVDEAIDTLRVRADAGDQYAAVRLVDLFVEQGRVDELRICASTGDQYAAVRLVDLFVEQGRVDELRICASTGDQCAAERLVDLLAEQGRVDELRTRADVGDWRAAVRLADLLVEQGHVDEAIDILRVAADVGDWRAAVRLADLLADQGRVDELRTRADVGDWRAAVRLVDLFVEQGRVDELRTRADAGGRHAAVRLADLLVEQGHVDEAIDTLRVRADAGDQYAAERLVDLFVEQGRVDELRICASTGDQYAAERLLDLLADQGRVNELRTRADVGDWRAAVRLVDLFVEQGRVDELRIRASTGDQYAAVRLADLLVEQGHVDEAIDILRVRADAGDQYAAVRLADLLVDQARVDAHG
ncbi:hypothetical protein [Micromonospora sp. RL09-050-HVF-A]|uniref:hypothetical protein n=1 Tax=Micromonospora sp. RL09-050-HVF-A TaxID=1703433 RepID=UPI001C605889|nr:hypothetical protein [Micromonospora sp. RL09-050-HVF-A]MBW4704654.1 hypothetical protein [Micromonospora sp. RL09-050-HVF-A]